MENNKKPNAFHCLLNFWSGSIVLDCEKQILIEDKPFLKEALSIGYTQKDTQALFGTDHYDYLTIDSISLKEEITDNKNRKLFELVKNYLNLNNLEIPEKANLFDLSFPGELIGGKNWEIKEWEDLIKIAKLTIKDPEELQKQINEFEGFITKIKEKN